MTGKLLFRLLKLKERLWVRPLLYCFVAILTVFMARAIDLWDHDFAVPLITADTVEKLLTIISSTMLAVATFAVGSMVSAYSTASATATPRAFALIVADDVSQAALSSFIGAFIFSIVAIIALKTGLYDPTGHLALFVLTISIFAWVIITFVRWVDNIARLGRVGNTVAKVEAAAIQMVENRRRDRFMGGVSAAKADTDGGELLFTDRIGHVCYLDMAALQDIATNAGGTIEILALPGTFLSPGRAFARLSRNAERPDDAMVEALNKAVVIGDERTFEEDPRFALIVLSETAIRALSPSVNDPGTAIAIIGSLVRVFTRWVKAQEDGDDAEARYDRVFVPDLCVADMFTDAFSAIGRDGAGLVEVGIRLQKAFRSLSTLDDADVRDQAMRHSKMARDRAVQVLTLSEDIDRVELLSRQVGQSGEMKPTKK